MEFGQIAGRPGNADLFDAEKYAMLKTPGVWKDKYAADTALRSTSETLLPGEAGYLGSRLVGLVFVYFTAITGLALRLT